MISVVEYEGISLQPGKLNVESKPKLGKVLFYKSFDLVLTCLVEHFYFYSCTQELFLPSCRARLFINVSLSNIFEKNGGKKKPFCIYILQVKTVLQVILQHASTSGVLCLNCSCTFMETAICCSEHFLYP